jgi:hypothetical protein
MPLPVKSPGSRISVGSTVGFMWVALPLLPFSSWMPTSTGGCCPCGLARRGEDGGRVLHRQAGGIQLCDESA